MRTDTPQPILLKDYKPSAYLIDHADLDVRLAPTTTRVVARLSMRPNPAWSGRRPALRLDGENLDLKRVALDGNTLPDDGYVCDEESLTVSSVPDDAFTLETEVMIDPKANTALSGLYLSSNIFCTQCEAEGFRRITWFLDRPDVLARYRVRIEADTATVPILLANGNPVDGGDLDGGRHFAVWEDPFPKPSYLFALVAGDLAMVEDNFTTASGRKVTLRIFVEHGKEDRCDWAMASLKKSMAWDEQAFGREYDLDIFMIVAVSDFNMGAMENKGLNVFNDKYILARPDTATDQDYVNIEAIIAHEYFHNWTGNRITCRDWFQLCLKEGLTVFRDQEFTSDMRSRAVKRIGDVRLLRTHQFPEDAGPLAHPVRPASYMEINNFYTATVYEKGAEVVRMIHTLIGAAAFRQAMDLYFERHDGEAATMEDFVQCMTDASGRDLSQFFRWYEQAGTPEVVAEWRYDPAAKTFDLDLSQTIPDTPGQAGKAPHHIPLGIGLVDEHGHDLPLHLEGHGAMNAPVLELTDDRQHFRFTGVPVRPVLSLNRGFSAPVKLSAGLPVEDRLFLMAHDSDPFNRWESGQNVARRLIIEAMQAMGQGNGRPSVRDYADALAKCLADPDLDPAFKAQMLAVPSETDLASHLGRNVDPQALHDARNSVRAATAGRMHDVLSSLWASLASSAPYSPDASSTAQRSLRHAVLSLIAAADPHEGATLALAHFEGAGNMSEMAGALSVLSTLDRPERQTALETFYDRFKDDHLLVDKWLSYHAVWPFEGCGETIESLKQHPAFNLKQPNKVRALVGVFASLNMVRFTAPDGSGFRLVAETIKQLDALNPQVAARMAAAFKSWRVLETHRRAAARNALEDILTVQNLSRDTYEIVSKSLN